MATEQGFSERDEIVTCGIRPVDIPGYISIETMPLLLDFNSPEAIASRNMLKKDTYSHEEIFGFSCTNVLFIECPVDMAYEYAANVYSLEEWTGTCREFAHLGGGLYRGIDYTGPSPLFARVEAHPGPRTVDYLCAWDQGLELWMRYYLRFVDAGPTLNRAGTVMTWTNCKHPYYDKNSPAPPYVDGPRKRTDRHWVGETYDIFYGAHGVEAENMKKILEARFHAYDNKGPEQGAKHR